MNKNLVVIYDLDVAYGNVLMSHLVKKKDISFDVKLITNYKSLEEIKEEIMLLLIDEALAGVELNNNVKRVLYLSEDTTDEMHLNRYQSVDKLIEHIKSVIHTRDSQESQCENDVQLIGVYCPIGGSGQTRVAKKIALHYARQGREVYYFDLGLIPQIIGAKGADFLYDVHEGISCDEAVWKEYFVTEEGVHYMYGSLYNVALWSLEEKDIFFFLQEIRKRKGIYIMDLGFLNQVMITLLEECDTWIVPNLQDSILDKRIENMEELLRFQHKENLLDKMKMVNNVHQIEGEWQGTGEITCV